MDLPSVTSSSNQTHDNTDARSRRRFSNRPSSSRGQSPNSSAAIAMPNRRQEQPPPALPPPKYIHDLAAGSDPGWVWGNDPNGPFGKPESSSAADARYPKGWGSGMSKNRPPEQPEYRRDYGPPEQPEYRRRQSSNTTSSTPRYPMEPERTYDLSRQYHDEGYYSLSGPSIMGQQLHGEKQLHHRDQEKSSQAYDNKLLSKIGKPTSPSRSTTFGSVESSPTSSLSIYQSGRQVTQPRSVSFPNSTASISSGPFIKKELSSRYGDSPLSRPISPPSLASSGRGSMDFRSPTFDHSSRSSTFDTSSFSQLPQRFPSSSNAMRQEKSRRSGSGSLLSQHFDDSASKITTNDCAKPVKVESYDPVFSEHDSTFMEETVRHLHLEDRTPLRNAPDHPSYRHSANYHPLHLSYSRSGMKRKQPPEPSHEEKMQEAQMRAQLQQAASAAGQYQQHNVPQHLSAQSGNPYAQHTGSISSQSATAYHSNSYASPSGQSIGGTSYTTMDQHSPTGLSPHSEQHYPHLNTQDPQYTSSLAMNSVSQNARAGPYPQSQQMLEAKPPTPAKADDKNNASNMQSSFWRCNCCPKKPKKFDTQEELRQHEGEKQHTCKYCSNRFKNKNEAERHQNSLHRRLHSWTCAVLGNNYDAVFFPLSSIQPPGTGPDPGHPPVNESVTFDVCGYCGEEFSNHPAPDWEDRGRHLSTKHKFGECNQSKKFYRADHFRQHLKHSHGGTSGKWTNALENACVRDEPQPTANDSDSSTPTQSQSAPVANMGSMGQSNLVQAVMGQADMGRGMGPQASIDEVHASMAPPDLGHIDMNNIDPNISIQGLDGMSPVGSMAHPQQHASMHMQQGGSPPEGYTELKDSAYAHLKEEL